MADTRLPASGALRVRWHAGNAFANPEYPTVSELNAGLDIADSISWNDYSFGVSASNTSQDPAITSKSNVSDRGATQYGGSLSFYHPRVKGDVNNPYAVTYAALKTPRTLGYISVSIDGDLSETNTALYAGGATRDYAAGDYVHIFKVMTAGYSDAATGEDAFRYTISFLPQGEASIYTVAGSGAATVVLTVADTTPAAGDIVVCEATVNGRPFTRGLRWSVSDGTKAAISQNGILRVKSGATGTFDVTATFEASGASDSEGITIT